MSRRLEVEERAAVLEFDGGLSRAKAGFKGGWAWRLPEAKSAIADAEGRQHD